MNVAQQMDSSNLLQHATEDALNAYYATYKAIADALNATAALKSAVDLPQLCTNMTRAANVVIGQIDDTYGCNKDTALNQLNSYCDQRLEKEAERTP